MENWHHGFARILSPTQVKVTPELILSSFSLALVPLSKKLHGIPHPLVEASLLLK